MLTVFRGNRAEHLAELLAAQLRLNPPDPFAPVQVVVNTWPTSRWLGEQLAVGLGGIAANIRYPFPGSQLRQIVNGVLDEGSSDHDPWRANQLVWPVLELLPELVEQPEAAALKHWLGRRRGNGSELDLAGWQLGRSIADALDDVALYRPDVVAGWWAGGPPAQGESEPWQRLLVQRLGERLGVKPFGLRVLDAIARLQAGPPPAGSLPDPLRLFGLSSLAPIQVQLLQALSLHTNVDLYLLTPCRDLWQRCTSRRRVLSDAIALQQPLDGDWLLQASGLEARFGRLGGEFQQLLEGSGDSRQGHGEEKDLFVAAAAGHRGPGPAPLLHQLQQQLADPAGHPQLQRATGDSSLEFHRCPGPLRQVQIVRDRILQLMADDATLQPRDVLVMTPQVDGLAPLVAAVFGDGEATGVALNWRLTDRSQQSEASLSRSLLELLRLAGERLTASALETLLESAVLQEHFQLSGAEMAALHPQLQRCGFHWGLDAEERGGLASGSLSWAVDRLLLGLVLPEEPGLAPADTAPLASGVSVAVLGRWLHLLTRLRHWLMRLRRPRRCDAWASCLRDLLADLFGDGGNQAWELPVVLAAIDDWQQAAAGCALDLAAPVVAAVLDERLGADSGRFGHRSGSLTISALEPMRAIPHRVIVLMGLDAGTFPRQSQRPGFHLLEQQRRLGDPNPADQDRYVLLEALLSARDHLLVTWSNRDPRSGEELPPATPVRQWLEWLQGQLPCQGSGLLVDHPANPLDRANFLPMGERPPGSCDQRLLEARRLLDHPTALAPPLPLASSTPPPEPPPGSPDQEAGPGERDAYADLRDWLLAPQASWLRSLGLRPREWADSLDDLEPLSLDERSRAALLRQALANPEAAGLDDPETWLERHRGTGLLPPQAAGELEAGGLSQRWRSLQASLEALGPERRVLAQWQSWQQELLWRGSTLVVLHPARPRSRQRLDLWLTLLLAAAADQAPTGGVLVARGERDFGEELRLTAPDRDSARQELQRLGELREAWRQRCWPVPPETGWVLLEKGTNKAIETWEGTERSRGERQEPEQALCFGADLSGSSLLASGAVAAHAEALLGPLRERLP